MTHPKATLSVALVVYAIVVGLAFLLAPHSCRGGFVAYIWSGVVAAVVVLAIPFSLERRLSILIRTAMSLGLLVTGIAVWWGSAIAAQFSVACF